MRESSWDTGTAPVEATECSHCGSRKVSYHVDPTVWAVVKKLCGEIKVEWQALLSGYEVGNDVFITGYYIPKQEVSGSSVRNLEGIDQEFIEKNMIVAGIHSHSTMGVFFSAVDDEATNMSFIRHNIVVNNNMEYKAKSRVDLPCGMVKFIEASVGISVPLEVEIVGFGKIVEKKWPGNGHQGAYYREPYQDPQNKRPYVPWNERKAIEDTTCPTCHNFSEESGGAVCKCVTNNVRPIVESQMFRENIEGRGSYDY